jgi:hypothetical protein
MMENIYKTFKKLSSMVKKVLRVGKKILKMLGISIGAIFIILGGASLLSDIYTFSTIKINNLYEGSNILDDNNEFIRKYIKKQKLNAVSFNDSIEYHEGSFTNGWGRLKVMALDKKQTCQAMEEYVEKLSFKDQVDFICEKNQKKYDNFKEHSQYFDDFMRF